MNKQDLINEAARLVAEARALQDSPPKTMSAEEVDARIDTLLDESDAKKKEADRLHASDERSERISQAYDRYYSAPKTDDAPAGEVALAGMPLHRKALGFYLRRELPPTADQRAVALKRDALFAWMRDGKAALTPEQSKAMSSLLDSTGGYLVDPQFESGVLLEEADMQFMRQICDVGTMTAASLTLRKLSGHITAYWEGETDSATQSTPTFAVVTFNPHKIRALVRVPTELFEDSGENIETIIREDAVLQFSEKENTAFLVGDGVAKPLGIFVDANLTDTDTASAGTFVANDVLDAVYALKKQYRMDAQWIMNRLIIKATRKFVDGNGQYMWQRGLAAGEPDTLAGYPVNENEETASTVSAGNKIAVFGNFRYYRIRDRVGISIQRLVEKYADTDEIGFNIRKRVDGRQVLDEAFVRLNVKA